MLRCSAGFQNCRLLSTHYHTMIYICDKEKRPHLETFAISNPSRTTNIFNGSTSFLKQTFSTSSSAVPKTTITTSLVPSLKPSKSNNIVKETDKNQIFTKVNKPNIDDDDAASSSLSWNNLQRMMELAKPEWRLIMGAAATLGMTTTVTLALPYAAGQVIDLALLNPSSSTSTLHQWSLGLFGLTTVAGAGVFARSILLTKAGNRIVERTRSHLFASLLQQEIAFYDSISTGDLISRMSTDANLIQKAVTTDLIQIMRAIIMSVGSSGLLFYTSPSLAIVSLLSLPPVFVAARHFGAKLRNTQTKVQERHAEVVDMAQEVLQGIRTVRQFVAESHEQTRYEHSLKEAHGKAIEAGKVQAILDGLVHVAANGAILGVLTYGGSMVASGDMTGKILYWLEYET